MLPGERRWQDYPHCWRHCSAWRAHVWVGGEGSAMTHGGRVRRALAAAGVRALRLAAGGSAPGFQQTVSAKVGGRRREKLPRRCRSAWKCRAEVTDITDRVEKRGLILPLAAAPWPGSSMERPPCYHKIGRPQAYRSETGRSSAINKDCFLYFTLSPQEGFKGPVPWLSSAGVTSKLGASFGAVLPSACHARNGRGCRR